MDFKRQLTNININNCVGTVLAINGHRKYFSVYHARREPHRKVSDRAGDFIGLDDSTSEEESDLESEKLFECDLLSGLPTWMDRLCEGTVARYRVEYWPNIDVDYPQS